VIPITTVSPFNAAGTVQFIDSGHNLGGPVRMVGGQAIGPLTLLSRSSHSITAMFTPDNPTAFKPSTSNTVNFTF
jgi:Bacterial Ig-like domain (group 3)